MGKVTSLHGTTPAEIFESGIENVTEIDSVAISVAWKDGTVTAGWSNIEAGQLALMIMALDEKQRRMNFDGGE
jgi:hypothetical protein